MSINTDDTGFISRWSRRKAMVRQGGAVADVAAPVAAIQPLPQAAERPVPLAQVGAADVPIGALSAPLAAPLEQTLPVVSPPAPPPVSPPVSSQASAQPPPQPTLVDVAALTHDSDYTRFVGRGVQPEVKNAALAKLFTDPHFNVMDRLDVYIDDYGKPDPLPPGMLRQMLQAHVLGLFDEEDEQKKAALAHATPPDLAAAPPTEPSTDENTDLQLQPDDDAGCAGPEPGTGQDAGGELGRAGDGPHPPVPA